MASADIIFTVGGGGEEREKEMLRLCQNGDILVRGKKVENVYEVYLALKVFIETSGMAFERKVAPSDPSNPTVWARILRDED